MFSFVKLNLKRLREALEILIFCFDKRYPTAVNWVNKASQINSKWILKKKGEVINVVSLIFM